MSLAARVLCGWHGIAGKYVGACLLPLRLLQVVERVGRGGGDAGGRRGMTPISFGVCCALLAGSQVAACRTRGTSSLRLLEVYD